MNAITKMEERRRPRQDAAIDLDDGVRRYFDPQFSATAVKILPGDHYVSGRADEMLVTVLGSCVAACIRDTTLCIGGMNHFMLPESSSGTWGNASASMRYGNFAMERLINDILAQGGRRERLEVKVFGGGNVLVSSTAIGSGNADFVEAYLHAEDLKIAGADLRGVHPRRLHYFPTTGKVWLRTLRRQDDLAIFSFEEGYKKKLRAAPIAGDVDLFD